jgi:hypothetical protein
MVKSPVCQPGDVSAAINQWRSGPCGPPFGPFAHCHQHDARRRTSVFQVRPRGLQANPP